MYTLLREYRLRNEAPELHFDTRLMEVADHYANIILEKGANKIDQAGFSRFVRENGYSSNKINLVVSGTVGTPEKFIKEWKNKGYKDVLGDVGYVDIGLAYIDARKRRKEKPELKLPPDIWVIVVGQPARKVRGDWQKRVLDLVNEFRAEHI